MKRIFYFLLLFISTLPSYSQSYEQWIDRYQTLVQADSLEAAEQALTEALKLQSTGKEGAYALSNLGTLQRRLGKNSLALNSYNQALLILPFSPNIRMNRASLHNEMNMFKQAVEDYSQVILDDPDYEEAVYLRGLARIELGDTLAAKQDFESILKQNKASALGRVGMATLYNASGQYKVAAELYSEVIKFNPHKASFYLNRAESYLMDNKPGKAMKDINKAIELDPDNGVYYYMRGKINSILLEKLAADADFKKAVELGFDRRLIDNPSTRKGKK